MTWLAQIVVFLMLGLLVNPHEMLDVAAVSLLIGVFMILVGRPLSVFLSLSPLRGIGLRSKLFVSWVGLRGAVPIIFATYPVVADIENAGRLAYVGSNFYRSGEAAGGLMRLMTKGEVRVGIVSGSRDILCHTERIAGFAHIIAPHPNIRIVDTVNNNDDDRMSFELTKKLFRTTPKSTLFILPQAV